MFCVILNLRLFLTKYLVQRSPYYSWVKDKHNTCLLYLIFVQYFWIWILWKFFGNLSSQLITFRKFHFLVDNFKFLRKETVSISGIFVFRLFWLQKEHKVFFWQHLSKSQSSPSPESESRIWTWAWAVCIYFSSSLDWELRVGTPGANSIISHFVLLLFVIQKFKSFFFSRSSIQSAKTYLNSR